MKIYWDKIPSNISGLAMDMDGTVHGWTKQKNISVWIEDDAWNFTITEDGYDLCCAETEILISDIHYEIEIYDDWKNSLSIRPIL